MAYYVLRWDQVPEIPRIIKCTEPTFSVSGQCDCACSTVPLGDHFNQRLPIDVFNSTTLYTSSLLHTRQISEKYKVVCLPPGNGTGGGIAVLNKPALDMLATFEQGQQGLSPHSAWQHQWGKEIVDAAIVDFIRSGFLVASDKTLSVDKASFVTPMLSPVLSAWLHITDRCNLRCAYCYLPHRSSDMSLEIGQSAIEAIFRSAKLHGYRQVKLKYSGGEPLLRFSLVVQLHTYAQKLAEQHDIILDGIILSNGTLLTPEIIKNMKASNLRLMISLDDLGRSANGDGCGTVHRCYPDGCCPSSDVMWAIELAMEAGLIPDISITVSGRNVSVLPQLLSWVLKRDLPFGLNFYRENNLSSVYTDLCLEEEKIIQGMRTAYEVIEENLPHRSLLASLIDRANLAVPHLYPCSVGRSYLVFDCQGQVARCQMQMNMPITTIRADDPLEQIQEDRTDIQNISVDQKEGCRSCEWKYWCAGGCPLETYRVTGRYDVRSPHCNIYKILFPELIRLEGLRLLKYDNGEY